MNKQYNEDFKKKLVAMVKSGKRREHVAKEYNISPPLLRYWEQKIDKEKNKSIF